MSYKLIRTEDYNSYIINHFIIDSVSDADDILTDYQDKLHSGWTAKIVVDGTDTKYLLDHNFEWGEVQESGGSIPSAPTHGFMPTEWETMTIAGVTYGAIRSGIYYGTQIPSYMFYCAGQGSGTCAWMTSIVFHDNLVSIGSNAFGYCWYLKLSEIPASVQTIAGSAFSNCKGLTSITFKGTPTSIAASAFSNCTNITDIYVPWASTDTINANAPWGATNATIHYNSVV